jgi:HNH endonuclease/NUMOD4 motif
MSQERARNESRIHTIPPPSDDDPEEWRKLPEELQLSKYQVSSLGRIKNVKTGHILSSKPRKDGYIGCSLFLDNKTQKCFSVHILVAKTFIPNEFNKETVNHINVKKHDNRVINLEWATQSEQKYKENNKPFTSRGKPIIQRDLEGNFIKRWEKGVDASKKVGISRTSISNSASGRTKTSGGFIWEYCQEDKKDLEGEIWKQISEEEYDNVFVSNLGRIKMKDNNPFYGTSIESGYYTTNLFNKIKKKYKKSKVHRLVCQAFLPNPDNKPLVNHLDENKSNNKLENLAWATNQENLNHSLDLRGRISTNCLSRIVLQIQNGIVINEYPSIHQASIKNGIPYYFIQRKCNGTQAQSGEFKWIFKTVEIL